VVERYADAVGLENAEDSAIRVILLRFLAGQDEVRAQLLAQPQVVRLFERELSVTLTREAGRVDLNAADPNLLFALFCANGWQERDGEEELRCDSLTLSDACSCSIWCAL
jgi:hypothetical protein